MRAYLLVIELRVTSGSDSSYRYFLVARICLINSIVMEEVIFSQGQEQKLQTATRRFSSNGTQKDLCLVVHEGSVADVNLVLASLKKNGGNINGRNIFGLTPLHIAVWRNHIPIVKRLLAAGADPNARVCFILQILLSIFVSIMHAL